MKTAYIFHDAFADQYADWYPWLSAQLAAAGYLVRVPNFPTPGGQSLDSWRVVMKNYLNTFDGETIFIGHGTGAMFALRLLEASEKPIKGLFLVAGYAEKIGHAGFDRVNETFYAGDFNWETIRARTTSIGVIAGDNDPYIPRESSERLAKNLDVTLQVIPDGGHLNKSAGFVQFVALAGMIRESEGAMVKGIEAEKNQEPIAKIQTEGLHADAGLVLGNLDLGSSEVAQKVTVPLAPVTAPTSPSIHTMYQDMTGIVNSNQGSVASSLLEKARTDEAVKQEQSPTSPKNIGYFFGTLFAIMAAVAILGYVFLNYLPAKRNAAQVAIASIIPAESHVKIDVDNREPYAIAADMRGAMTIAPDAGSIRDIYYVTGGLRAPFVKTLESIDVAALPEKLATQINAAFMHGVGSTSGKSAHFLVIPSGNYDSTFAGLRQWEPTMFHDIGIFMNVSDSFLKTKLSKDDFSNEMIANRNLRVLRYKKPAEISLDEFGSTTTPPSAAVQDETPNAMETSAAATSPVASTTTESTNFISESVAAIQNNNPFVNPASPYQDGELMIAYFFLNERTVVITDNVDIIPEILARYANRQIYQ